MKIEKFVLIIEKDQRKAETILDKKEEQKKKYVLSALLLRGMVFGKEEVIFDFISNYSFSFFLIHLEELCQEMPFDEWGKADQRLTRFLCENLGENQEIKETKELSVILRNEMKNLKKRATDKCVIEIIEKYLK